MSPVVKDTEPAEILVGFDPFRYLLFGRIRAQMGHVDGQGNGIHPVLKGELHMGMMQFQGTWRARSISDPVPHVAGGRCGVGTMIGVERPVMRIPLPRGMGGVVDQVTVGDLLIVRFGHLCFFPFFDA